jgi:hypothetical protein
LTLEIFKSGSTAAVELLNYINGYMEFQETKNQLKSLEAEIDQLNSSKK